MEVFCCVARRRDFLHFHRVAVVVTLLCFGLVRTVLGRLLLGCIIVIIIIVVVFSLGRPHVFVVFLLRVLGCQPTHVVTDRRGGSRRDRPIQ